MTHEDCQERLALHALGALDGAEAREVAMHLVGCPDCSQELEELRDVAAGLAYAADPAAPSAALSKRILDLPQLEPRGRAAAPATPPEPIRAALRSSPAPPEPVRRRWRPLPTFAGLAAAAVIVFLVFSQINLVAQLDAALTDLDKMREIGAFVTSPDVSVVSLWGTSAAQGSHAKLAYDQRSGSVMLFPSRLGRPPKGKTYQLWVIGDRIQPAGAFSPDSPGVFSSYRRAAGEDRTVVFGVTLEPASGAASPSGEMVLLSAPIPAR